MKFFSFEVALYLYKSNIRSCVEHYCHVWAGAHSCYLEMLGKLRMFRTVGTSFAASLEPLGHRQNVASLSFLMGIGLVDVHLNWLTWFKFLILVGDLLAILRDCLIFFVTIPRCYKNFYINSFFPRTAELWN